MTVDESLSFSRAGAFPNDNGRAYRALLVADRLNWVYDRKARMLARSFRRFQATIGYVCPDQPSRHPMRLLRERRYDIIWHLGFRMGHDPVNRDERALAEFVERHNRNGTAVVAESE